MVETGSWNGHVFAVSPTFVRGFTGLTIKGASETSTKTWNEQQYSARKAGKPVDVSLTVELHASLGCNVRGEALNFVADARDGAKDYFYVGGKKLISCQLMLTEASIEEVQIAPNGTWVSARAKLSMQQASKNDGSLVSSGDKNTTQKASVKTDTSATKTSIVGAVVSKAVAGVKATVNAVGVATSALQKALAATNKTVSSAKAASKSTTARPAATKTAGANAAVGKQLTSAKSKNVSLR